MEGSVCLFLSRVSPVDRMYWLLQGARSCPPLFLSGSRELQPVLESPHCNA